jgi:Zn-dependent alcohol dehydrogenase
VLIKSTLAAVLFDSYKPLELVEIEFPKELTPGQVVVELITSGICGAQINEIDAVKGVDKFLPHLLGHEGLARVIEVGPGVVKVTPGDQVVLHWRPSSGMNSSTPKYLFQGKQVNAGWVTTFNKHAIVSENRITKVKATNLDPVIAPLLGCALTTALGVLENDAKFTHRDSLLIVGFGGVGISLAKFAQFMHARKIVIIDTDPAKEEIAKQFGIHDFILSTNKDEVLNKIKEAFGDNAPTVAIDTSGHPLGIEICYEATSENGRIVLVGVPRIGNKVSFYTLPLHFGKSITGSKGGGSIPDTDIPFILDLVSEEKLTMNDYPVSLFAFNEINTGIDKLRSGTPGRIVISF